MRQPPTEQQLKNSELRQRHVPRYIKTLVHGVCIICLNESNITLEQILSDSRNEKITDQRHICIYTIRLFFPNIKYKQLATIFNRDHSTCMHSVSTVEDLRSTYKLYDAMISQIEDRVILYLTSNKK